MALFINKKELDDSLKKADIAGFMNKAAQEKVTLISSIKKREEEMLQNAFGVAMTQKEFKEN